MVDTKIVNLTGKTVTDETDEFVINDVAGGNVDKKVTIKAIRNPDAVTKTASATLTLNEELVLLNPSTSAMTITLPAASGNSGKTYKLIYISTTGQPVTIDGNAAETINGQTTTLIEHYGESMTLYCDGSNWFAEHSLPQNNDFYIYDDDFVEQTAATLTQQYPWFIAGVGTEAAAGVDPLDVNHIGLWQLSTGSAAIGDDINISLGDSAALRVMDFNALWDITWIVRPNDITNITIRFGLTNNATSNSWETVPNASFLFDPAVSANWRCRTRQAADETTTTATAVVINTFYKLKIIKDGTTIRFYLDNVNVANHATQVPTAVGTPAASVDNTTALSVTTAVVDRMYLIIRGLASR